MSSYDKAGKNRNDGGTCGKVTLVGAGPGDAGLITVKGLRAVREADCIIYDRLCAPELLREAKPDCEKIYVGKENHYHTMPQAEINRLMAEKARQYVRVVRLKGGDAYVFGRGGEEGIYLRERGIAFSVIPGVSSAIAGPAYAGIPITHRGLASGFRVVTAHNQKDQMPDIDFSSMRDSRETLVFLMGLGRVEEIAEGLLKAGRERSTPAAVISHATTAKQRSVIGTLETIAEKTRREGLTAPALIVVGDVVSLGEQQALNFFEMQPLSGKRYLVPVIEPLHDSGKGEDSRRSLAQMLREAGAWADEVTVGQIQRISCAFSREALLKVDWMIFTSGNGVTGFFENLRAAGIDIRSLANIRIAVIGKQTANVLLKYGIQANFISEKQQGEGFAKELSEMLPGQARVWYLSAVKNSGAIERGLKENCRLITIPVYENRKVPVCCEWGHYDGIFITSASSASRLFQAYPADQPRPAVYSIGPRSTGRLQELGITEVTEAGEPSCEALVSCVLHKENPPLTLMKPAMDYAEEIMQYRKEFLAHNPEEDMGGTGNLRSCETAEEWIRCVEARQKKETIKI